MFAWVLGYFGFVLGVWVLLVVVFCLWVCVSLFALGFYVCVCFVVVCLFVGFGWVGCFRLFWVFAIVSLLTVW